MKLKYYRYSSYFFNDRSQNVWIFEPIFSNFAMNIGLTETSLIQSDC